jgi:hypothetical protein
MKIVQRMMATLEMEEAAASWTEQRANIRVVAGTGLASCAVDYASGVTGGEVNMERNMW